ncbi:chromosome partitioning protein ParB, partial [Klebsiella pneumoniae]|nr:chromosome partitioning protein ParB [Klebsiella pneumoniae]
SAAEQVWVKLMPLERQPEFADLFSTALATFNGEPEAVVPQLVQDELLGEMSCRSGISWNTLLAELTDGQSKRQVLLGPPVEKVFWPPPPEVEKAPLPEPEPPTEPAAPDEPKPSP